MTWLRLAMLSALLSPLTGNHPDEDVVPEEQEPGPSSETLARVEAQATV